MKNTTRSFSHMARVIVFSAGLILLAPSRAYAANNCAWTGASDTNWANAGNWSSCGGVVPTQADTVTISSVGNQPTISTATANAGSIAINSGATLTLSGNQTLNIGATGGGATNTFANNGGTFNATSGTVVFKGMGTNDPGSTTTVSGSGTFNFNSITINTTNLTVKFDTDVNVSGTFSKSSGDMAYTTCNTTTHPAIIFSGTVTISGSGTPTFCDLTISAGTTSVSTNIEIVNALSNDGTFDQSATKTTTFKNPVSGTLASTLSGSGSTIFGSLTVQGNRTINASSHSFTLVGTSWSVSSGGTFNGGTATVTFNPGSGNTTTISGTGTHNLNNVTISSGTLSYSAGTVRVSGNWTNNAAFTAGTGTVTFNGTSSQVVGGSSTTTFNNLTINSGAIVALATKPLVSGAVTHNGLLRETQTVNGSANVDFICLGSTSTNCSAYKGVTLNANNSDLGSTIVDVMGNSLCGGVSGTVRRCYDLRPTTTTGRNATATFFFLNSELNGENCDTLNAWRYTGSAFASAGTTGTRQCSTDPRSIQVTGIANFSVFALKTTSPSVPTPITIASIEAESGGPDWTLATIGCMLAAFGAIGWATTRARRDAG
ncbi:MAG: hypothetical protein HZC40_00195 [Chloroflexi bacterium]|nr:hypothetical protein [Chloroflexota bacterium]